MEKYQEFEQSQRKAARLSEGVDFDDVRIREFSRAEMDSVMSYMSMGTEVVLLRDMIERISITNVNGEHQGKVVHIDLGSASNKEGHDASSPKSPLSVQPLDQFLIDLKQKLEEAEKKQQEHKPEWLKQWQEQQKHLDDSKNPVLKQAS
ncbi:hypothetical protein EW026_g2262 [Hermanssonia centrifuga]|uniref:Uncharacterized protein n=1 Tax=Hermanssonia centrifuga TaxID=98765 RepID=A0A4S4KQQ8_9APHY|nr:hypothetical protein EW026_g2262 [Hermanssonia centrifuga]